MSRFVLFALGAFSLSAMFHAESASAQSWGASPSYARPSYGTPALRPAGGYPPVLGRSGQASAYDSPFNGDRGYCGSTGNGKPCCATCRPEDCANGRCAHNCRGECCSKNGACCSECRPGDCARGLCSPNCRGACCTPAGGYNDFSRRSVPGNYSLTVPGSFSPNIPQRSY